MWYRFAADLVLAIHLAFIAFVVLGGLIALRFPWTAAIHLPAAAWGVLVEVAGRACPLTAWENAFRRAAGEAGYDESFIEHYVLPIVYPAELTREVQFLLAGAVVAVNAGVYAWLVLRRRGGALDRRARRASRRGG